MSGIPSFPSWRLWTDRKIDDPHPTTSKKYLYHTRAMDRGRSFIHLRSLEARTIQDRLLSEEVELIIQHRTGERAIKGKESWEPTENKVSCCSSENAYNSLIGQSQWQRSSSYAGEVVEGTVVDDDKGQVHDSSDSESVNGQIGGTRAAAVGHGAADVAEDHPEETWWKVVATARKMESRTTPMLQMKRGTGFLQSDLHRMGMFQAMRRMMRAAVCPRKGGHSSMRSQYSSAFWKLLFRPPVNTDKLIGLDNPVHEDK
ncbi:F-box family protein [Striga asiatica]|uniref:F-box family protein n=1 Tax=Striga asiatica TaxID=4170 RepID=A0A5A7QQG0_STRAF|nr:F-box family protein [Striga asiatica]